MKMIKIVFLLSFLLNPIFLISLNENQIINFDGDSYKQYYKQSNNFFKIIFNEGVTIEDYLKIEVSNTNENDNPNFVVAFSNEDESCLEREQLSYGINNVQMWLTKAQLEKENLYMNIICSSNECNYELKLSASPFITIGFNSQFNLYVTENNQNVDVVFSSDSEIDDSDYITIWAIGNKNVEVNIESSEYQYKKYSKNNIFKIQNKIINTSTFSIKVKGEEDDVINIGSSTIGVNYNKLRINQPEIKGYLEKEYNNEECYEFQKDDAFSSSSIFYLSGFIYSKIAEIYYKNENNEEIPESANIIKNGSFIHNLNPSISPYYFCIRFPKKEAENYTINEIYYSLQLTNPNISTIKLGLYSPQIYGELYPRILQKGDEYSYVGITPHDETSQISIDMISQYGFSDMFFHFCKNYPICSENEEINPRSINGHSTYKTIYVKKSPMSPYQYILYVKCLDGPCGFKTSFNSDIVNINLKEDEPFSQFILKGEKDLYKVDYSGEKIIRKIYVDLMVFTGDVSFNTDDSTLDVKKLYNANKIFYIITLSKTSENQEIFFSIFASKNSYYSIEFSFIRENDDSYLTNIIEPGSSFLVTINPEEKDSKGDKKPFKIVRFTNLRMKNDDDKFLVQFYSLNCKLNVTSKKLDDKGAYYYEEIKAFDKYYQDLVLKNIKNDYEYMLRINETDSSIYNNKLCMVYASSLELESLKELDERQIVISDNEPKQMAFKRNEIEEIEYLYPHSNSSNDVIININLLDIAQYTITVSFAHIKSRTYAQSGNDLIYLSKNEWKTVCNNKEICPIIIKIKLASTFVEMEPKLLISVKAVQDNIPSYLPKNKAKLDFLLGNNWQYYYTDLGKDEEGDVLVSYRRGSGRLFGKIVPKNLTSPEEGANWRENYKFPTTVPESLEFYGYIKKILIRKNQTSICEDGCYLLLSLKTSIVSEEEKNKNDFREHPFSIIIHTRSSNETKDIPIINIPLREYIIGNLYTHEDNNIYEYYSTIFTHDAEKIIIDFQSKVVNFYINVGADNKPIFGQEIDFKYESNGQDTIFEISKKEFLEKCIKRNITIPHENSLLGLSMAIGLWTNKTDSFYTTVYSIKIHLPFYKSAEETLDIYEVKSDQKTLCKTQYVQNSKGSYYRCLFMVFYLGIDPINHLLLYPLIQDHSSYYMYADFIAQEKYEFFDYSYLRSKIPNENEKAPEYRTNKTDYIYIEHGKSMENFVFVSVVTKTNTIVELLTSLYSKDIQLSPNPSSPQLFLLDKNKDHFLFEFTTDEDLTITIKSLCGEGNIYWEVNDKVQYHLHGRENFISLTNSLLDKSNETEVFSNLYIKNKNISQPNCPGLAFYIDYLLRPSEVDLDEIQLGKSTQIAYRNTDLPVYIYSKLKDKKDTNIFVNLYELIGQSYSQFTTKIPFEISCAFVDDTNIMNAKISRDYLNKLNFSFKGIYDPMIRTGFVLIKKGDINLNTPNVIIKISKNKDYPQIKEFTRINLEASIIQDNSNIPIVSDIYHYGKLSLDTDINIYKLRTDRGRPYMRILYSPNSEKIQYSITKNPGEKSSFNFGEYKTENIDGKTIITFNSNPQENDFIYLNIFHNDPKAKTDQLTNYAFKYMISDNINNFILYQLSEEEKEFQLEKNENGDKFDYTFKISPLKYNDIDVTYFIKFVEKDNWIEGEGDNCIALRESTSYVEELKNINLVDGKINKKYENMDEIDYRYVQVIALVEDNNGNIEFVGYQSIYVKDSIVWKIVLIIIAAIIVLVIVIYLIHLYIKRKRNIDRKIKNIEGPMVSRMTETSFKSNE